jgi:hypothetical protein
MVKRGSPVFSGAIAALCCFLALAFSACAGTPASGGASSGNKRPVWVNNRYAAYNELQFVAETGTGGSPELAAKNALANLVSYFGQSIQADQQITNTYQSAVKSGAAADWAEDTCVNSTITTSAALDSLVGAEIRETWFDGNGTYYALAVMDKAKTARIYTDMIKSNQAMIARLVEMSAGEKTTLEGFSRYQLAAAAADINIAFGNLLSLVGSAPPAGLQKGDAYRLAAEDISKSIPVAVEVKNDRDGRIRDAFAKALAELRFKSGGASSGGGAAPYVLQVDLSLNEVQLANQQNKFVRYVLNANLVDVRGKTTLLPYSINGREGHLTLPEAENRAVASVERRIGAEYKNLLSEYLAQMLPKK